MLTHSADVRSDIFLSGSVRGIYSEKGNQIVLAVHSAGLRDSEPYGLMTW